MKTDNLNSEYWNSIAERLNGYHLEKNIAIYKRDEHINLIKRWYKNFNGKKILKTDLFEEAFGPDQLLGWFLKQGSDVFGIDISSRIVNRARFRMTGVSSKYANFSVTDVRKTFFEDETFDLIISNSTLDNLSPQDISKALSELNRILKPNGELILTLDNAHNPLYSLGYIIEKALNTNKYYQGRCYAVNQTKRLAKQNNFRVMDFTAIVHLPTPFNKLAILLSKIDKKNSEKIIKRSISFFSKFSEKKTRFLTGWFIALRLVKDV